jgi:hypothetical protein
MTHGRSRSFWIIATFLVISILLMLVGQTTAVFNYELAVGFGLQESTHQISEFGVQINRAFGVADTIIYIPLMVISLYGLLLKKNWSLLTTAAVAGISTYWSVTVAFVFLFLPGTPGYIHTPGFEMWVFVATYTVFGVWSLGLLVLRGPELLR